MTVRLKYNIDYLKELCIKYNINYDELIINEWNKRDTVINGKCVIVECNNLYTKSFRYLDIGSGPYCIDCTKQIQKTKTKNTNLKQFGVENPMQCKDIYNKAKNTIKEKYGVEHQSQLEQIKDKKRKTCNAKYGVNCNLSLKDHKEKIKITNLKKYGVENVAQSDIIKERMKNTNLRIRGVSIAMKLKEVQNKAVETNLKRYGVKYPSTLDITKEKCKKTNIKKYGVEHPMQNVDFFDNLLKSKFNKYKDYMLPSGKIIKIQGYEPFALDILIESISEDDIFTSRRDVPEIWYYDENGKKHRYYTDIYIKSLNKLIEVKSIWTYKKDKNKVIATQKAIEDKGLLFECWIFNNLKQRIYL
jgi:hypothetical protein